MSARRIAIAHEYPLVRAAIRGVADRIGGVEVVGEAGNGGELLDLLKRSAPDLVLLEDELLKVDKIGLIKDLIPEIKVLLLAPHSLDEGVCRDCPPGVDGYLLTNNLAANLSAAIETIWKAETPPTLSHNGSTPLRHR